MQKLERAHLAIVRQVHEQGSLTAAAEALCLTQSALSHAMKKLEQQVGAPLWQREGRHLRLTPAGEHLLAVAQRVLPQLEQAEERLRQLACGEAGTLRIGMECHPCYRWLLKVVAPYLAAWPGVDVDVKQKFQFGGIGALFDHEIDLLVTPDPLPRPGLRFEPVFDYEQVLVVSRQHPLANVRCVRPQQLAGETLITYPVQRQRLDIYTRFLAPAGVEPLRHKTLEDTGIMLQMVASGRGVTALPRWLAQDYARQLPLATARLGARGIAKQIHLGARAGDLQGDQAAACLRGFIELARSMFQSADEPGGTNEPACPPAS